MGIIPMVALITLGGGRLTIDKTEVNSMKIRMSLRGKALRTRAKNRRPRIASSPFSKSELTKLLSLFSSG